MNTNDQTMTQGTGQTMSPKSDKERVKLIAMGGVPGILVGAGALYAGTAIAATPVDEAKAIDDDIVTLDVADGAVHPEQGATAADSAAHTSVDANGTTINVNINVNTPEPQVNIEPEPEPVILQAEDKAVLYSQVGQVEIYSEAPIAHSVNDSMSFSEAFAAARAEVGPGGVFHYRGGDYGTYYAEEWQGMTREERDLYADSVHPEVPAEKLDVPVDNPHDITINIEINGHDVNTIVDDSIPDMTHEASFTPDDIDISIDGMQQVTMPDGQEVTVLEATVDGTDVAFIDLDSDGEPDIVAADLNHDGDLQQGEAIDLHTGEEIDLIDDSALDDHLLTADNDIDYNNDFINDADVSLA